MQNESSYEPKTMLETNHDRVLSAFKEALSFNTFLKTEEDTIIEIFDNMLYNAMLHEIPIPFDKIIEKIGNISFSLGNRYVLKEAYQYDVSKNKIELKQSEIENDSAYYFTTILYDLALQPEYKSTNYFESLYKGEIYDLSLSTLGLTNIPTACFDEVILYRSLKSILGEEVIANGLLTSDCSLIYQTMQDFGFTKEDIQSICNTSNYNQYGRYPTGNSSLLDTQMHIIDVFLANAQNNPSTRQKMHYLKKTLKTSSSQQKDGHLKYGLKKMDNVNEVLNQKDLTNESPFSILSDYLDYKSSFYGFDEMNYGKAK